MKVAESMVNTMDWMKHTNSSRHIMNTLITTLTIDMPTIMTMPLATTRKMMHVRAKAMACPAIMLAKSRIIRAKGLVKIPMNSMKGINGTGALSHVGTSGQKMSFQ